eukprot:CAMPEP_0194225698 /NCGR_PEP_ID=MMETSP0156-20130528/40156_1 /TAXON_ID=33649 /ORGANISM="Thalassionema nitzschioides, Strain L26-B" /LENGTH=39 /DNA_ID= /DNA_START= /DNA_END= /DNA_ORIENTATION=
MNDLDHTQVSGRQQHLSGSTSINKQKLGWELIEDYLVEL